MSTPLSGTVRRAHAAGGAQAVRSLARAGRGPLIEATTEPDRYDVTFVFADRRGGVSDVGLFCPAVPDGFARLVPLGEATFAGTFPVPAAARVRYHFCPEPPADLDAHGMFALAHSATARRIDYFNPRVDQVHIRGLRMRMLASLLVLPGAPVPPPLPPAGDPPTGAVRELSFDAGSFGHDKRVALYLPAGHHPDEAAPVVLLLESNDEWHGTDILDGLVAQGRTGAFVGVLLGGGRHYTSWLRELGGGPALTGFVVDELLPEVGRHAALAECGHIAAGFSAAAIGAATICAAQPRLFSRLAAISGAWHLGTGMDVLGTGMGVPGAAAPSRLVERYRQAAVLPRRAYLAAGRYEQSSRQSILDDTRALAGILSGRGSVVRFDSGFTDHDAGSARVHLCAGLRWLLGDD